MDGRTTQDPQHHRVFVFHHDDRRLWEYDWNSGTSQRERARTHVFRAYALAPVVDADTLAVGTRRRATERDSEQQQRSFDDDAALEAPTAGHAWWQVVGWATSTPFTLSAYRKPTTVAVESEQRTEQRQQSQPQHTHERQRERYGQHALAHGRIPQTEIHQLHSRFYRDDAGAAMTTQRDRDASERDSGSDCSSRNDSSSYDVDSDSANAAMASPPAGALAPELERLLWARAHPSVVTATTNLSVLALFVSQIQLAWLPPLALTTRWLLPLLRVSRRPGADSSPLSSRMATAPDETSHRRERLLLHFVNHCASRIVSAMTQPQTTTGQGRQLDNRCSRAHERDSRRASHSGTSDAAPVDSRSAQFADATASLERLAEQCFDLVHRLLEREQWSRIEHLVRDEAARRRRHEQPRDASATLGPATSSSDHSSSSSDHSSSSSGIDGDSDDDDTYDNCANITANYDWQRTSSDASYARLVRLLVGLLDGVLAADGMALGPLVDTIVSSIYAAERTARPPPLEQHESRYHHQQQEPWRVAASVVPHVEALLRNTRVLGAAQFEAQLQLLVADDRERMPSDRAMCHATRFDVQASDWSGRWVCRSVEPLQTIALASSSRHDTAAPASRAAAVPRPATALDMSAISVFFALLHAFGFDLELSSGARHEDGEDADGITTTSTSSASNTVHLSIHSLVSFFPEIGAHFTLDNELHALDRLPCGLASAWLLDPLLAGDNDVEWRTEYCGCVTPTSSTRSQLHASQQERAADANTIRLDVYHRSSAGAIVRVCFEMTLVHLQQQQYVRACHYEQQEQQHASFRPERTSHLSTSRQAVRTRLQVRVTVARSTLCRDDADERVARVTEWDECLGFTAAYERQRRDDTLLQPPVDTRTAAAAPVPACSAHSAAAEAPPTANDDAGTRRRRPDSSRSVHRDADDSTNSSVSAIV